MNNISIISPDTFQSMPWRNGLGTTIELVKENLPNSADFSWRISMADVIEDGEFSSFNNCDRILVLLEGTGITLDCEGTEHRLVRVLQHAAFRGDDETYATLHNGPIKDFNIITHRDYTTAQVDASPDPCMLAIKSDASRLLVYAVSQEITIDSPQFGVVNLAPGHLLLAQYPEPAEIDIDGPVIAVQLFEKMNRQ